MALWRFLLTHDARSRAHAAQPPRVDWQQPELLLLREAMKQIGRSLDPQGIVREMLHLMSELLGLNRGRLVLVDDPSLPPSQQIARIAVYYGLTAEQAARGVYRAGEGLTGQVLATGQPALVQDIDSEPQFLFRSVVRSELPEETVAFLALPVWAGGNLRGVLACHRIRTRQRSLADDLSILGVLATLMGQVLQLHALSAQPIFQRRCPLAAGVLRLARQYPRAV